MSHKNNYLDEVMERVNPMFTNQFEHVMCKFLVISKNLFVLLFNALFFPLFFLSLPINFYKS